MPMCVSCRRLSPDPIVRGVTSVGNGGQQGGKVGQRLHSRVFVGRQAHPPVFLAGDASEPDRSVSSEEMRIVGQKAASVGQPLSMCQHGLEGRRVIAVRPNSGSAACRELSSRPLGCLVIADPRCGKRIHQIERALVRRPPVERHKAQLNRTRRQGEPKELLVCGSFGLAIKRPGVHGRQFSPAIPDFAGNRADSLHVRPLCRRPRAHAMAFSRYTGW
jgi:hypothetical protein